MACADPIQPLSAGQTCAGGLASRSKEHQLPRTFTLRASNYAGRSMSMTDLDLVPTEDLLKALRRRFDHMVFAGIKNMGGGQGEDFSVRSSDHSFGTLSR